jgi:6-phosphogluconolactonase
VTENLAVEVLADPGVVAKRAAELIVAHARSAVAARDEFAFAVSGGSTPWTMLAELARFELPWSQTALYQVDERVAPAGDEARNLTHLLASLPAAARPCVHAMPVEDADIDAAAQRYARALPDRFDLIHLGLGLDGHTASLVPGDPVLEVFDRDVALSGPYMGRCRMTLTYPVIDRARALLWVVTGADKRDALGRLRWHDSSIPAGRVAADRALVLADVAAAGD